MLYCCLQGKDVCHCCFQNVFGLQFCHDLFLLFLFHIERMPFLYILFLITTLFPIPYFAHVVGRHVLGEQSATGEVYISTNASTLFSSTFASRSSVQPSHGRNSSFAISRNTTGFSTFAAVSNNGSYTGEQKFSSKNSSIASTSNALPAVTPLPGLSGKITTTWTEWTSSRTPSRTAARIASATGNRYLLATTASTSNLSSRLTSTKTSVGSWPASISFCSLSDGIAVVEVGFVTTFADGKSSITNTSPSQSLISTSAGLGCAGEIAVFSDGLTTTIQLSTLPSATSFPQDGAQVLTQSGSVVQYSPQTLSGYDNPQPIKISTNFVEVINGHTTTQ